MMTFRLSTGFAALGCVLLASCYAIGDKPQQKKVPKNPEQQVTQTDPQALKEQEALQQKQQEELAQNTPPENPGTVTTPGEKPKAPSETKRDYAVANKVPGKEGFVFSPYNNKVIDVRDIASGTLVTDPTYPTSEKKFFRVP
jgi:hypothetical protein